jgi:hypothetical protein
MVSPRTRFPSRLTRSALLAACLLSAVGCAGYRAAVSGTVTVAGKPVAGGTIYFADVYSNNDIRSAEILSDGTYTIDLVQGGTYAVTLTNPKAPLEGVIPDRYAKSETSGLSFTPEPSPYPDTAGYTYNIDLTP